MAYTKWTDDLSIKAIRAAMKKIGTEYLPTQTELLKMKYVQFEGIEVTGNAINNRICFMGGYVEVAKMLHLKRKGKEYGQGISK